MIAEAVLCAALNVYHEARSEPWEGRMAVALVTRNRARANKTTVCWEVFRDRQFTWTEDRRLRQALPSGKAWQDAIVIARTALNTSEDFTHGATEYHVEGLKVWWAPYMIRIGVWGHHVFYKRAT
jgi:spore germination cell wall hydrolase CwlJ-like protein